MWSSTLVANIASLTGLEVQNVERVIAALQTIAYAKVKKFEIRWVAIHAFSRILHELCFS